jgi:uncharacterized protein (DUF488 family)
VRGRQLRLSTIGYERLTQNELIDRLRSASVSRLIDVRAVAASRRPGFSKRMLAASLAAAGIEYRHLRALGTPKAGREAARAGHTSQMQAIYRKHLETPEATEALAEACALAAERPTALLCLEAEAAHCHRRIVAEAICASLDCEVIDL